MDRQRVILIVASAVLLVAVGAILWQFLGGGAAGSDRPATAHCGKCGTELATDWYRVNVDGFRDEKGTWRIKCAKCGTWAPVAVPAKR